MKYWRNIITDRRMRTVMEPLLSALGVWRWALGVGRWVASGLSRKLQARSNLDIPVGDTIAVVLQHDVALEERAELGPLVELAGGHLLLPLVAGHVVFDDLGAVQPVLDAAAVDDEAQRIPCARGTGHVL